MSFSRFVPLVAALALCGAPVQAEPLTPKQALSYIRAGDFHFSPDGSKLAYVETSYAWDALPHLYVMDVAAAAARDLTPDGKSERAPQWSPDGMMLAFLSNRGGKTQVFTMPTSGGNPTALTSMKNGVQSFHWSPDGKAIAFLAKTDDAPDEDTGPQLADDPRLIAHLWLMDVATKKPRDLAGQGYRIDDFQWQTPERILIDATDKPRVEEFTNAIYAISVGDGAVAKVAQPPEPFSGLVASPDGKAFTVRAPGAGGPLERDLFWGSGSGDLKDISTQPGLMVADVRWHEPSAIWVRVVDGFHNEIWKLSPGSAPVPLELKLSASSFDVSSNGDVAFAGDNYDRFPEIYLRAADGKVRQLGELQKGLLGARLANTTIFKTKSFDGTVIEAALMKPYSPPAHSKMPLVLLVHGGPSSNFSAGYGWEPAWAQLLAAHGYEVLMVNPRGSNGYSEDFLKANRGDWGGGDYKDLMAVLDAVIAKGETDPNRLGIGGWSYGGEMSEWAITQTGRFKAAVVGAGVYDQQAEFETERGPAGDEWYFGTPWEHPDVFARNSPSTYIAHAHTPALIFDGIDDESNPVGQSKGLYRALKHLGVETEMVLYPDEGHSPRKGSYNVDMFTRILGWYDKYLSSPGH